MKKTSDEFMPTAPPHTTSTTGEVIRMLSERKG